MSGRLVLASASPRRRRLLAEAGIAAEVVPADVDETPPAGMSPEEVAVLLAERKARAVEAPGAWVLAADTLLDLDGEVLGKPRDEADARAILRRLSGRAHAVVTGVAVRAPDGSLRADRARTLVTFRALSDDEIDAYVRSGEPMDKAGAYGIQGGARAFVARVEGPMDNVVGLPIGLVRSLLAAAGYA